jgi:hypothetical protein
LRGRMSKAGVVETGEGEPTGSGDVSLAFIFPPKALLTEEVIVATFMPTVRGLEVPSLAGVPTFGNTHFFFDLVQAWQERLFPPVG